MLEDFQGDSWGSIPPLRMLSLLPHDLCHGQSASRRPPTESDTTERLHFHFHALEKEMATHSSVLAWRIPGMAEPGGLPSMESHRVRHNWSDLAAAAAAAVKWCPTLCNLMECSMPGCSVLHYLLEFAQTHVHWLSDAIQPSHPLSPRSVPAFILS